MLESDAAIAQRVRTVQAQIAAACSRAGRSPEEVTLIAVTKRVAAAQVAAAAAAGVRVIGENLVQEAVRKFAAAEWPAQVERHFIGHLQRNKAAAAVAAFRAIHSVDSPRSADAIARAAERQGRVPYAVFLQVNIAGEATKFGVAPDELGDLARHCRDLALDVRGVMAIPPPVADPEASRPYFRRLRRLGDELAAEGLAGGALSMGMSGDYQVAVEEGATHVRVGTAIFGERA